MNLQIKMVGIDHNKASLEYRELFSFTMAGAIKAMEELKKKAQVRGCVILSTCNRTELWFSIDGQKETSGYQEKDNRESPYEMLCRVKRLDPDKYEALFIEREGEAAIMHLMELASGLDSKIFGEDQIISQVREAMVLARDCKAMDPLLEKIFQTAMGAGKKVKSTVKLTEADQSAALHAVALLLEKKGALKGVPCLVIGNGQMGTLVAQALLRQEADVKMTLRKSFHKNERIDSSVPEGCTMIPYEERIEALSSADVVISATKSPHYTLKKEEVKGYLNEKPSIWIDLAVPRDMDSTISQFGMVEIYDMDHMDNSKEAQRNAQAIAEAKEILKEYMADLRHWFGFREMIPEIREIVELSAGDMVHRIEYPLEEELKKEIERATEKTLGKLFFGLKDNLREPVWKECIQAIHQAANKDTLKS